MDLREIDRLVAEKVMGWKSTANSDVTGEPIYRTQDDRVIVFNPSTNISDAWQVVEKLKIAVIPQAGGAPKNMQYLAEIDDRPLGKHYEAFAETAPLAICLAALKAVGVEVEVTEQ